MLEVNEFPGPVPGLPLQSLVADGALPPRLARMKMSFDRLASRSAAEQGIAIQSAPGIYALWGRMSDGVVLGLHREDGVWRITRVPVPSGAVRLLDLPDVLEARSELLWVEIALDRVDLLRDGQHFPLWSAEAPAALSPRGSALPGLSVN